MEVDLPAGVDVEINCEQKVRGYDGAQRGIDRAKVGMTQVFAADVQPVPVTVLERGPAMGVPCGIPDDRIVRGTTRSRSD